MLVYSSLPTTSKLRRAGIFILLIAGGFYYANVCSSNASASSPNPGHRGDFFHRIRDLRSTFAYEPTAPILPLNVRTDNILRSFNFRSLHEDPYSREARPQLSVPPPYGQPYVYPPSYEASVSDYGGTPRSPISPSTPESAAGERSTVGRNF